MWVMVGVLKIVELVGDVLEVTAAANNGFYVRRELSVMIVVVEEDGGRWREVCCHGCLSSTVTRHHLWRGWC